MTPSIAAAPGSPIRPRVGRARGRRLDREAHPGKARAERLSRQHDEGKRITRGRGQGQFRIASSDQSTNRTNLWHCHLPVHLPSYHPIPAPESSRDGSLRSSRSSRTAASLSPSLQSFLEHATGDCHDFLHSSPEQHAKLTSRAYDSLLPVKADSDSGFTHARVSEVAVAES